MSYRIAGIDVHKRILAVVVTDVEIESEYQFERRMFSSNPEQLRSLAAWLLVTLSFVPDAEQRLWRTVTRKKYQLRCDRVRLQNQLESLLEEAHIELSSLVSDLFASVPGVC